VASAVGSTVGVARPSLFARLLARVRRRQAEAEPPPVAVAGDAAVSPSAVRAAIPPLDPLTIRQWLWGPGFAIPGNAEHALGLVRPFGLDPSMSMLDVAACLGGPARAVAEAFSTYVTGLERDPEIARRGMEMSVAQGMAKRAPISAYDPEALELRHGSYDCILGRQATYTLVDKERFLRVLILALKQRGQLLLTDLVADPAHSDDPALAAWAAGQPIAPRLWTVGQYTDCLTSLGFDLRITEDTTHVYHAQIVSGWAHLLRSVDLRRLPRPHLIAVVDEAEHWMRTVQALDRGALKTYRFYGLAARGR
jgi:SAM-dependent methyltransferase